MSYHLFKNFYRPLDNFIYILWVLFLIFTCGPSYTTDIGEISKNVLRSAISNSLPITISFTISYPLTLITSPQKTLTTYSTLTTKTNQNASKTRFYQPEKFKLKPVNIFVTMNKYQMRAGHLSGTRADCSSSIIPFLMMRQ